MQKLWPIGTLFFLVFVSCNQKQDSTATKKLENQALYDYRKLPERIPVNSKAKEVLDTWKAFGDFSKAFEILYQARNDEDLKLAIDDLIEKEKLLEQSEYPELFEKSEVKSRQRATKTFLLKTLADLQGSRNPTESTVEMVKTYNAFRNQFNSIANNPIDTKLILNEQ